MPFSNGLQIGPYRILEQLGQGGMATVYKAYHASLDRYVAIKVLHQAFMEDPNFLARFQREARLVAKLEHSNIVPIYDYAEHEGQPYLVMKYIEGETLKARLQRGPLNATEVETFFETVGAALTYAHKQNILHRDVKPSNVILAKDGGIYLADFGLARIAQSGESTLTTDMVLGTPQYISPEQAMAKKDLDAGTDIYSLGVMLYEMTVGRVPFSADTPFSVIHDHIYAPLPLPSTVNPKISLELERVLLKALAKERADRFVDVAAFVEAFKAAWTNSASTIVQPLPAASPDDPTLPPAVSKVTASAPLTMPTAPEVSREPATNPGPEKDSQPRKKKRGRWMWLAILVALCLCCSVIFFALRDQNGNLPAIPPVADEASFELTLQAALPTEIRPTPLPAAIRTAKPDPNEPQPPNSQPDGEEKIDLIPIDLGAAKEAVGKNPAEPKAHLIYGFALIQNQQTLEGYQQIKESAALGAKNRPYLTGAARTLEKADLPLGGAIMYLQLYRISDKNLVQKDGPLASNLRRDLYYGFSEPVAPEVLDYGSLGQVNEALSLIAQARYTLVNRQDPALVQKLIDELRLLQPGIPEANLLQAELWIATKDFSSAEKILAETQASSAGIGWIIERTKELQQQIK